MNTGFNAGPLPRRRWVARTVTGLMLLGMACLLAGCHSPRQAHAPTGPHFRIVTYNVNWGGPRPDLAAEAIRQSGADIVCLQETTPEWEKFLRHTLRHDYHFSEFRHSQTRYGGGLAFLSKWRCSEVAYIPSQTGWFDGWIMKFETPVGPVQVLNVHLRPPVSDGGSWVSGYFSTRDDRVHEIELFYDKRTRGLPTLVVGDFNDTEGSRAVKKLEAEGFTNALAQFDRSTPTWRWRYGAISLKRRMDHILFSPGLECCSARVIPAGASDHLPVEAVFAGRLAAK